MDRKSQIMKILDLQPLADEGGVFSKTYTSSITLQDSNIGVQFSGVRAIGSAIYYLITDSDFSALHRLRADEIFHFYSGDPAEMIQITSDGSLNKTILGSDILAGQRPQVLVPKGNWQGTKLSCKSGWALLGTTTFPGFEFADFELGARAELLKQFPEHDELIRAYTRE